MEQIVGDYQDHRLIEVLLSCQRLLVDSELERARHKEFNYAKENLLANIIDKKLDHFFNNLNCAAKMNLALGFILRNIEDVGFSYFYAHENITLLDRPKVVCTKEDLAKQKNVVSKTNVIESCSRERLSTNKRFYKLTNLTVSVALLKHVPMGCKDAILPESLLRNGTINYLRYEENTRQPYNKHLCFFRAPALHLS